MLDLNYVRENLASVRAALEKRSMPTSILDDFVQADSIRRRAIAESDQLNADRNTASREIGALMKEGKREEAEDRREQANFLKESISRRDSQQDENETRIHEWVFTLPNVTHDNVPL